MLDFAEISWVIFPFFSKLLISLRLILRKQHQKTRKNSALSSMALSPAAPSPALSPSSATTPTPARSPSPCSLPWPKVVSPSAAPPPSLASKPDRLLSFKPETPIGLPRVGTCGEDGAKVAGVIKRKRPARLLIPEMRPPPAECDEFGGWEAEEKVVEVEGSGYCVVGKKGRRRVMEDGYGVITDVLEDPKQAFFGVFDGHGGRGAVDFVTEKLGRNILSATKDVQHAENGFREAIRTGYLTTDKDFLSQGVGSGACAATVLVENGNLHAANVGDCRVVLSRNGVAIPLTSDHRAERADERRRVENLGGYVDCINGVWRVQGSLAVSRAIGDVHMKEWVTCEPEINEITLSSDCEFLIMASDGLWDKVSNQEAVDEVMKNRSRTESCRKLVEMSSRRGNKDDITIMVVDLLKFM
ncbi:probable protein phosphatase 2C 74 [Nymphaea colorata]|nr:probable protein phosphatase 2C 74 [Nymphaea colorata]